MEVQLVFEAEPELVLVVGVVMEPQLEVAMASEAALEVVASYSPAIV